MYQNVTTQMVNAGFWQFQSIPVQHCQHAYGVVMVRGTGNQQWSLVYSGDCRPSKQLIQAGHGCTLLIHEATFEGALQDDVSSTQDTPAPHTHTYTHTGPS